MSLKGLKVPGNTSYEEKKRFVNVWATGKQLPKRQPGTTAMHKAQQDCSAA